MGWAMFNWISKNVLKSGVNTAKILSLNNRDMFILLYSFVCLKCFVIKNSLRQGTFKNDNADYSDGEGGKE